MLSAQTVKFPCVYCNQLGLMCLVVLIIIIVAHHHHHLKGSN